MSDNANNQGSNGNGPLAEFIKLKVKDVGRNLGEIHFGVNMTTELGKMMKSYADRVRVPATALRFLFNGRRIQYDDTPRKLKLKDEDDIVVFPEQTAMNEEMDKIVESVHKEHYKAYPMVLIRRSHTKSGVYDRWQCIEPDKNYVFTRDARDKVKIGRMLVEVVGLNKRSDISYYAPEKYLDMEQVSSPQFAISRPSISSESVWIQDLSSRKGTFVNGQKLKPHCKLKIYDGDVVSIGIPHLDPACDLGNPKHYVFKILMRSTKYNVDEIELHNCRGRYFSSEVEVVDCEESSYGEPNEAVDSVLRNSLITSMILGYMNFGELKHCRLINKVWDEQISGILAKKGAIQFDNTKLMPLEWDAAFGSQVQVMKPMKVGNIKLNVHRDTELKVTKDFCWLMDNFGGQMKDLKLRMDLITGRDAVVFQNILKRLSFVQKVELDLTIEVDCKKIKFPSPLETVRNLNIRNIYYQNKDPARLLLDPSFLLKLLKVFENIETLSLGGYYFMESLPTSANAVFLPFRNLKTLEVNLSFSEKFALYFLQTLKSLPGPGLENLMIHGILYRQPVFDALRDALIRHAPTLESLRLRNFKDYTDVMHLEVEFPQFPKLKTLEFYVKGEWNPNPDYGNMAPFMTWKFPSGQIYYKDDFPLLENLDIGLHFSKWTSPYQNYMEKCFFEAFVPLRTGQKNTCNTMRKVHFSIPFYLDNKENNIWGNNFLESFYSIFPNAILTSKTLEGIIVPFMEDDNMAHFIH